MYLIIFEAVKLLGSLCGSFLKGEHNRSLFNRGATEIRGGSGQKETQNLPKISPERPWPGLV